MSETNASAGRRVRRKRIMLWSLLVMAIATMTLPLGGYLYVSLTPAQAADASANNPHANYWRAVREGDQGYTAASGPYTTDRLINNGGENYRNLRNGPVASIAPWVLAVVVALILLFFLFRGRTRVEAPPSGRMVERWSGGERFVHWYVAIFFIILAITGMSLLFGRAVLIPILGLPGFAAYASFAKVVHNYSGPLFMVGVIVQFLAWVRYNTFKGYDWEWLKKGGGMFKRGVHPPAGRANAGEKIWFWIIATIGLIGVCVTGLIYDFPNFGQNRELMQTVALLHASFAMLWIAISLGHIYLGTLGVEGAFKGMAYGQVSEEWMKQHHSVWWEQMQQGSGAPAAGEQASGKSAPGPAST